MYKLRWIIAFAILIMLTSLPALAQDDGGTHTVQSGENLFRIALRYGVDMTELASANDITNLTQIYAGQVLVIPGLEAVDNSDTIENPLVAAAPVTHTVQQGEYLGQIATLYNLTIEDILTANNIANADSIFAGQQLQIWTTDLSVASTPAVEPEPAPEVVVDPRTCTINRTSCACCATW